MIKPSMPFKFPFIYMVKTKTKTKKPSMSKVEFCDRLKTDTEFLTQEVWSGA
jgi:hypothetical protein